MILPIFDFIIGGIIALVQYIDPRRFVSIILFIVLSGVDINKFILATPATLIRAYTSRSLLNFKKTSFTDSELETSHSIKLNLNSEVGFFLEIPKTS